MAHRPHRSADQWQPLIERQARSGKSARAFCREHDLGYASFMQWRSRLANADTALSKNEALPPFIELTNGLSVERVDQDAREGGAARTAPLRIELDLGGGIQLTISRGP